MQLRGWMLDAARLVERSSHYRRTIELCAEWGLNAIVFRLTDDQGCAMRFESHPELVTHPNALSVAEMRELVAYGDAKGVMLIPEIESFGHTQYITAVPQYADLVDRDLEDKRHASFNGVIPVHPKTLQLMADLYRETAAIFTCPYLHGGCDEVNWGGAVMTREAIAKSSRGVVWAEYINRLCELCKSNGKEFIIWADHVVGRASEEGALDRLNKDIILYDWDYWTEDSAPIQQRAEKALAQGLRLIGGPAYVWCKWGPRVGREQLVNIDAYAEVYRGLTDPKVLGVLVTNWVPGRYVAGTEFGGLAFSAVALQEGRNVARAETWRRFVERHYGTAWDERWADLFSALYAFAVPRRGCSAAWKGPFLPVLWRTDEELKAALTNPLPAAPPFTRLRAQVLECAPTVRKNLADFRALDVSLRYQEHLCWRVNVLFAAKERLGKDTEFAKDLLGCVAERDAEMLTALRQDWVTRRYDVDGEGTSHSHLGSADHILLDLQRAAAYSRDLAASPDRVRSLRG
ncbi:MAG: hypothetical protein A3K19_23765 [Lentisphaerae bacterium RIFOXYB12_FULL_65_16]|nr:MAG: hypothetical protein A3K19_23765 [Lentisphaerae bacterium RIFOXYB12_FULL_65_16]